MQPKYLLNFLLSDLGDFQSFFVCYYQSLVPTDVKIFKFVTEYRKSESFLIKFDTESFSFKLPLYLSELVEHLTSKAKSQVRFPVGPEAVLSYKFVTEFLSYFFIYFVIVHLFLIN